MINYWFFKPVVKIAVLLEDMISPSEYFPKVPAKWVRKNQSLLTVLIGKYLEEVYKNRKTKKPKNQMIKYEKEFDKKFGTFYVSGFKWQGKDGPDFGGLDMKRYINKCLLRQIDEDNKRFLGYVGENEECIGYGDLEKPEMSIEIPKARNELRAELRDKVNKK